MPESAVWEEPIARVVIEEITQLLGYDPADVIRVRIEPSFLLVDVFARDGAGRKIVTDDRPEIGFLIRTHRHSIL